MAIHSSPIDRPVGQVNELDINNQTLYQLAQYLQVRSFENLSFPMLALD